MPILTEQERCGTLLAGKYQLESILGRGGMGVVFRATHAHTHRPVAIKILRPELSQDRNLGKRFIREARAASLLQHPNVVEVLDLGIEDDGTIYQVLQLLEGEALSDLLDRKGPLPPERTLEILLPVMDALVAAHAQGIVHRDLKPDNIFLARTRDDRVKPTLLDFGIAKLVDAQGSFATRTGSVMGTPHYMAPEQARGARDQGPAIDVWAMGVIAFECLTGSLPFDGETPTLVMVEILTGRAPRADERQPSCPGALADAIEAALEPDLAARVPSMSELVEMLRDAAERSDVPLPAPRDSTAGPLSVRPVAHDTSVDASAVTAARPPSEGASAIDEIASVQAQLRHDRHAPSLSETLAASPNARPPVPTPAPAIAEQVHPMPAERRRTAAIAWSVGLLVCALLAMGAWWALGADDAPAASPPAASAPTAPRSVPSLAPPPEPDARAEPEARAELAPPPEPPAASAPETVIEPSREEPETTPAPRTRTRRPHAARAEPTPAAARPDPPEREGRLPGVVEW